MRVIWERVFLKKYTYVFNRGIKKRPIKIVIVVFVLCVSILWVRVCEWVISANELMLSS